MNSTLTSMQLKKLEKRWNDIIAGREDRVRRYMLKQVNKSNELSPTEIDSETEVEVSESVVNSLRTIKVVDRFGIILQIFASRAKNRVAQI